MNREIKFRFWCKGTSDNLNFNKCGWWTYPNFLLDKYFANFDIFESEDFVACQYTGLKDSKGKEIYEGDILRIHDHIQPEEVVYVAEGSSAFGFWKHDNSDRMDGSFEALGNYTSADGYEVIGSVFENPELL